MIILPTKISPATGAGGTYVPVPANMTLLGYDVTTSAVTGCTSTVIAKSGSTTIGTCALASDTAAGAIINGVMSTTLATRKTLLTKAIPLKFEVDARTNSCEIFITAYLDEFALQRD